MDETMAMQRPLAGLRVLELSQIMAGPTCGLMLADLGADVIKVEKPPKGDDARNFGVIGAPPPSDADGGKTLSPSFMILNRGKRSVALDIKQPAGKAALLKLVAQSDVITQNFRPGTMERLGLGYADLAKVNPAIIYCSISGYGRQGPLADRGGYDLILQAFSGLISVTGEPGRRPVKPGISVADVNAGLLATIGILGAYVQRLKTGKGQLVETSLLQAAIQQTYWFAASYFATGQSAKPMGTANPVASPYQTYACADGQIALGAGNQTLWVRLAQALQHEEWVTDPRFLTPQIRLANRAELEVVLESVLKAKPRAYWFERLDAVGVPVGMVQSVGEALDHAQTRSVDMVIDVAHPDGGVTQALGFPIHLSGGNEPARSSAPRVGQHTRSVFAEFGFDQMEIAELFEAGVLQEA